MMELRVEQFLITTDKYQYILNEVRRPEGALAKKEESVFHVGNYTDLEYMLFKMLDIGVKESTAKDLKEIIELLKNLKLYNRKASNAIIEAINNLTDRSELPRSEPRKKDLNELIEPDEKPSTIPDKKLKEKSVVKQKVQEKKPETTEDVPKDVKVKLDKASVELTPSVKRRERKPKEQILSLSAKLRKK